MVGIFKLRYHESFTYDSGITYIFIYPYSIYFKSECRKNLNMFLLSICVVLLLFWLIASSYLDGEFLVNQTTLSSINLLTIVNIDILLICNLYILYVMCCVINLQPCNYFYISSGSCRLTNMAEKYPIQLLKVKNSLLQN